MKNNLKKTSIILLIVLLTCLLTTGCRKKKPSEPQKQLTAKTTLTSTSKKKILYVDSYHEEYAWVQGITEGMLEPLNITMKGDGSLDNSKSRVELKIVHMDTKRNQSEDYMKSAALKTKNIIETWQPNIVIISDDNAFRYLVMPYYKDAELPFVFCGVNWDVSKYENAPYKNTTGMIEVMLFPPLVQQLKKFSKGERIGFMGGDVFTAREIAKHVHDLFHINFYKEYFVKTFAEWKRVFVELQDEVDILVWVNYEGIEGWNNKEAEIFVYNNTKIPIGTVSPWMMPYTLIGLTQVPQEQGQWAAKTAMEILGGKSPSEIPITTNKQSSIHLNMPLAKKIGIKFSMNLIEQAHLFEQEKERILFINSYHKGYQWSDDIEASILKALNIKANEDETFDNSKSDVELKIFRMDTKLNTSEDFKEKAALKAKDLINAWMPDVVIASDDNASKYLIVPYFKNTNIPFVFCGVNWDASVYGFPRSNVTGMVEVDPVLETLELLKKYAKGKRIGHLAADVYSSRKILSNYRDKLNLVYNDVRFVSTFKEWKSQFLRLQKTVDMLHIGSPIGIQDWSREKAIELVINNSRIPSLCTVEHATPYALLGRVRIPQEQGWWAAKTALEILKGKKPSEIPIVTNKKSKLYLNMELAKKLGITFPMELIDKAIFVDEK